MVKPCTRPNDLLEPGSDSVAGAEGRFCTWLNEPLVPGCDSFVRAVGRTEIILLLKLIS